jgi:hypothetical protein
MRQAVVQSSSGGEQWTLQPYQHRPDVIDARFTAFARHTALGAKDNFACMVKNSNVPFQQRLSFDSP